jgi:hypothetical protein
VPAGTDLFPSGRYARCPVKTLRRQGGPIHRPATSQWSLDSRPYVMLQCSSQSDSGASISEAREIAESHRRQLHRRRHRESTSCGRRVRKATTPGWRAGGQAYRPCLSGGESRTG